MNNQVHVDQSNKIEDSGSSYLAFSDGVALESVLIVPARVKGGAITALRKQGKTKKQAVLLVFSACVYLLLKRDVRQMQEIILDNEYDGHGRDIKAAILRYCQRDGIAVSARISVRSIGKKSPAHQAAWEGYRGKRRPDQRVNGRELLAILQTRK